MNPRMDNHRVAEMSLRMAGPGVRATISRDVLVTRSLSAQLRNQAVHGMTSLDVQETISLGT